MNEQGRPRSVLDRTPLELSGYNSVVFVAAVIYNELVQGRSITANEVVRAYNMASQHQLGMISALSVIQKMTGLAPLAGHHLPWEPAAPPGHFAVFCLGRPQVFYGFRDARRASYLYDPQSERDRSLEELRRDGYGPFLGFHYARVSAQPGPALESEASASGP
ncbi:MAG: hypothetical protein ACRENP_13790 [Longimicrobiales bacterium]